MKFEDKRLFKEIKSEDLRRKIVEAVIKEITMDNFLGSGTEGAVFKISQKRVFKTYGMNVPEKITELSDCIGGVDIGFFHEIAGKVFKRWRMKKKEVLARQILKRKLMSSRVFLLKNVLSGEGQCPPLVSFARKVDSEKYEVWGTVLSLKPGFALYGERVFHGIKMILYRGKEALSKNKYNEERDFLKVALRRMEDIANAPLEAYEKLIIDFIDIFKKGYCFDIRPDNIMYDPVKKRFHLLDVLDNPLAVRKNETRFNLNALKTFGVLSSWPSDDMVEAFFDDTEISPTILYKKISQKFEMACSKHENKKRISSRVNIKTSANYMTYRSLLPEVDTGNINFILKRAYNRS